jgi:hypothetical protein
MTGPPVSDADPTGSSDEGRARLLGRERETSAKASLKLPVSGAEVEGVAKRRGRVFSSDWMISSKPLWESVERPGLVRGQR